MLVLAEAELIFFTEVTIGLFWICAVNIADNRDAIVITELCSESRPFLLLTSPLRKQGVHKKQRRDTDGTADPD